MVSSSGSNSRFLALGLEGSCLNSMKVWLMKIYIGSKVVFVL